MALDRIDVINQRRLFLADKRFEEAYAIERQFLQENPDDIQFLYLASLTAKKLGQGEESRRLRAASDERYRLRQVHSQNKNKRRVKALVEDATRDHDLYQVSSAFDHLDLIDAYDLDDVPLWPIHNDLSAQNGDIAELHGFGRFRVGDIEHVLNKRLSRGLPWEAPIAVALMELASRLSEQAVILDIGANIGTITIPTARTFNGRVFAFEPFAANADVLADNLELNKLNNVELRRTACGAQPGRVSLDNPDPNNPGMVHISSLSGGDVAMTTIDAEMGDHNVGLVKMDVEGHEFEVLKGMTETVERCAPILICEMIQGQSRPVRDLLAAWNYSGGTLFRSDWLFFKASS